MPTQDPGYYRDILNQLLMEAMPPQRPKPTRNQLEIRRIEQMVRQGSIKIPTWMRYLGSNGLEFQNLDIPTDGTILGRGDGNPKFGIGLSINDHAHNIKNIVIVVRLVNGREFRVVDGWIRLIHALPDYDQWKEFVDSQEFQDAVQDHLNRVFGGINELRVSGDHWSDDGVEMFAYGNKEDLETSINRQLESLKVLIDDDVSELTMQTIKALAAQS
jgi:hypothetical protein